MMKWADVVERIKKGKKKPSQKDRILNLLKANGKATNVELNKIAFRYSDRIYCLRKEGHVIVTNQISNGLFEYIYKGEKDE